MTWYWITEREKPENPVYDWQSREPVIVDSRNLICAAWRDYDNSDASFDGITHEEAVLAAFATERIKEIDRLAEAGLCQMTAGGKHEYLTDIRNVCRALKIQGGLTK